MEVERFDDPSPFRARSDSLLLQDEAANSLLLGVTTTAVEYPDRYEAVRGWVVVQGGEPIAAAVRTVPYQLILGVSESEEAMALLAATVGALPGVVGCRPGIEVFVRERPEEAELTMSQGVFSLDEVTTPSPVPGVSRQALPEEVERLVEMWLAFAEEALGRVDEAQSIRDNVRLRIDEQSTRYGLWAHVVEDEIVSVSGHSGPTPNGVRIGGVFTPQEQRGQGFATNLVAAQSRWLLDNGRKFCFLYTDLANPTSNSIYRRIGYHQIAESAQYVLSPKI